MTEIMFRNMFFTANKMLFEFAGIMFSFIMDLAKEGGNIAKSMGVDKYAQNIYMVVGVVMLFRLGIILLQYISNPEKIEDKKDGIGKHIIPHVLTVLVLIVFVPTFFNTLYNIQEHIVDSGFLAEFFDDGENTSGTIALSQEDRDFCEEGRPNSEDYGIQNVGSSSYYTSQEYIDAINEFKADSTKFDDICNESKGSKITDTLFLTFMTPNFDVWDTQKEETELYINEESKLNNENYDFLPSDQKVKYSVLYEILNKKAGDEFLFNYNGFISFVIILVVIFMLSATVFTISLRIFKLLSLQILAPVPIILYVDPSPKKKGETSLERWFAAVIKAYADLFIRVLVILFVATAISDVLKFLDASEKGIMLKLFIIVGGLLFMNIAPVYICALFNIVPEGGMFNPFTQLSKLGENKIVNKVGGTTTGTAGGLFKGGINGGVKGALAGMYIGASAGRKSGKAMSWGAGRDAVGGALANGPSANHSWMSRYAERMASDSMRSGADAIYTDAQNSIGAGEVAPPSPTGFQTAQANYDSKKAFYHKQVEEFNNLQDKHDDINNKFNSYKALGDEVQTAHYASALLNSNNKLIKQRGKVNASLVEYDNARKDYVTEINKYNEKVDAYKEEIKKINIKTGKDQIQYKAESGKAGFDKIDKDNL